MRAYDEVLDTFQTAVPSIDAAKEKIKEDPSIPGDVRRVACERFEGFLPRPDQLVKRAESALDDPNSTEAAYQRALTWAEVAARMAPEDERIGEILAQVRDHLNDTAKSVKDPVDP